MKLAYFDDFRLGVVKGESVVDVMEAVADIPHIDAGSLMNGLIARFERYRARIAAAAESGTAIPLARVTLRPPLPRPGNLDCMAVNYMENGTLPAPPPINAFQRAPTRSSGRAIRWCCPTCRPASSRAKASLP